MIYLLEPDIMTTLAMKQIVSLFCLSTTATKICKSFAVIRASLLYVYPQATRLDEIYSRTSRYCI